MYKGLDKNIESEVITLSGLKNIDSKSFYGFYDIWRMEWKKEEEEPNKSKEQITAEIKEEINKNNNKLEKESLEKYYTLKSEKTKELEDKLNQMKLKVNFNSKPKILGNGKLYTISRRCFTLYDDKFFNKLYEIQFEDNYNITSAIQLDNKDLVFFAGNILTIYRLKDEKYSLFQIIEENPVGYALQNSYSGCMAYTKTYKAESIKEISGNRFICISNYGLKIYSLNEKNEYSITLLERYAEGPKKILELDKDTFIFCTEIYSGASLGGPAHNRLIIDKISLNQITKEEKECKLNELKERGSNRYNLLQGHRNQMSQKEIYEEEVNNVINSLKFSFHNDRFFEYSTYGGYHYFKGNAILNNKLLVVGIDNEILIFDISSGKQLKRYEISVIGEGNLYKCGVNIRKWNNNADNEFFINIKGNIILFALINDSDLRIIGQSHFQNIVALKHLSEKSNKFYDDGKNDDGYSKYYSIFHREDDSNDNKEYCISIY